MAAVFLVQNTCVNSICRSPTHTRPTRSPSGVSCADRTLSAQNQATVLYRSRAPRQSNEQRQRRSGDLILHTCPNYGADLLRSCPGSSSSSAGYKLKLKREAPHDAWRTRFPSQRAPTLVKAAAGPRESRDPKGATQILDPRDWVPEKERGAGARADPAV
jgi:hypothetical protein